MQVDPVVQGENHAESHFDRSQTAQCLVASIVCRSHRQSPASVRRLASRRAVNTVAVTWAALSVLLGVLGVVGATAPPVVRRLERQCRRADVFRLLITASSAVLVIAGTCGGLAAWGAELWETSAAAGGIVLLSTCLALPWARRTPAVTLRPRRILAVGAHPDDVELACGATIAKLVDAGHMVRVLVMSHGEGGGPEEVRIREAEASAAYLGVTERSVLDFPDTVMAQQGNRMVAAIERALQEFSPDIVLTHSATDVHQDHEAVHRAVMRAGRRLSTILCFESPSVGIDFTPRFFVDVADYTKVKVESVRLHSDQMAKPYMTRRRIEAMAGFRGTQVKARPAEGFEIMRMTAESVGDF